MWHPRCFVLLLRPAPGVNTQLASRANLALGCSTVFRRVPGAAQDLSAPDPLMILPLVTSGTLLLMSEIGADGVMSTSSSVRMKAALRGIAVLMVPLTMNFSSGIFVYFTTSNAFSIGQTALLRVS